jgi:hypothetical protein
LRRSPLLTTGQGPVELAPTVSTAERTTVAATIAKLTATIPLLERRVEVRKYLNDHQYGSKLTYLETLQDLTEHQQDLAAQQVRRGRGGARRHHRDPRPDRLRVPPHPLRRARLGRAEGGRPRPGPRQGA